jgi:hypothetical protein
MPLRKKPGKKRGLWYVWFARKKTGKKREPAFYSLLGLVSRLAALSY